MKKLTTTITEVFPTRDSVFGYSGWPSVCRGPKGDLLAVCSGGRLGHVCTFGKVHLSRSSDEGKTWSAPEVIIDTPLDDRDAGITTFGKNRDRLIVTSFNHYIELQKSFQHKDGLSDKLSLAYLNSGAATAGHERRYFGSTYKLSEDGGISWSEVKRAPVTAPHGPMAMSDGSLLYMGNPKVYAENESERNLFSHSDCKLEVWHSQDGESWTQRSTLNLDFSNYFYCETNMAQLPGGEIIAHIRVQGMPDAAQEHKIFAVFQCESTDGGASWSEPKRINEHGSPPHLLLHSSGRLICAYGRRIPEFGEIVRISEDGGKSWGEEYMIASAPEGDLGYPASVELNDGSVLTVYYQKPTADALCQIYASRWILPE